MSRLQFSFQRRYPGAELRAAGEFNFGPGRWIQALMGDSGAGKTSFARWLAGLDPGGGDLRWEGEIWESEGHFLPPAARRAGLVAQGDALFPHLNLGANVGFALRKIPAADRRARVSELLALVGLAGKEAQAPDALSGGEKRRAALAQALAARPRLLILDEPFTGLHENARRTLGEETKAWLEAARVPTILITHDEAEAAALAARTHRYAGRALNLPN